MRLDNPGYKLEIAPFQSTADTLIGDPRYGFPCPWIETCYRPKGKIYDGYHSSGDTLRLMSRRGMAMITTAAAGYLYYLADAGTEEALELAAVETARSESQLAAIRRSRRQDAASRARCALDQHRENLRALRRWLWSGDHAELCEAFGRHERRVREAAAPILRRAERGTPRVPASDRRIPRRPRRPAA